MSVSSIYDLCLQSHYWSQGMAWINETAARVLPLACEVIEEFESVSWRRIHLPEDY